MGSMVCLCGKRYRDPINMYTQEKDPFFICVDKCMKGDRDSDADVNKHNDDHTYGIGKQVWGK